MDIKAEFHALSHRLYAAFEDDPGSPDEVPRLTLGHLGPDERERLTAVLEHVLDGRYSDAELEDLWNASDTDVGFFAVGEMRRLLTGSGIGPRRTRLRELVAGRHCDAYPSGTF